MNRKNKNLIVLWILLALLLASNAALAQIDLRFTPADTTFEPGATTRISVMLDDAVYIRTIDLTVTYDSTLVRTVGGGKGSLFSDSGFYILDGIEESVPGYWHGYAIIMGAIDSLSGPGELFAWDVVGLAEGTTAITAIEALLYEPNAFLIPDVTLDPTTLRVRWAPTAVDDLPLLRTGLDLYPNPFNPRAQLGFDLQNAGQILLAVYDARGRRVATLHEGYSEAGPRQFHWDGRDDGGQNQPGGVYLFRLESRRQGVMSSVTTKGILLK